MSDYSDEAPPVERVLTDEQKSLLREWVADLRSGEFEQTTGQLCELDIDGRPIGHCCLGVLEERLIKNGLIEAEIVDDLVSQSRGYLKLGDDPDQNMTGMPHPEVFELIGGVQRVLATIERDRWDMDDFVSERKTERVPFEELNDAHGFSFGQIADAIEADYL